MQVTRKRLLKAKRGFRQYSITVDDLDLTEEELAPALDAHRSTLLDLLAEKYIVMAIFRDGGYHRDPTRNEDRAGVELSKITILRDALLKSAR